MQAHRAISAFLAIGLMAGVGGPFAWAQNDLAAPRSNATPDTSWKQYVNLNELSGPSSDFRIEQTPATVQPLLMGLVLKNIPADYENTKKWGGQREVWDGLHVRMDGLKIHTKRRKKLANHGSWKRYHISLIDPREHVQFRFENVHEGPDEKIAFDMFLAAKLAAHGRFQEWNRGVRLLSISAEGIADVQLRLTCLVATQLDVTKLPPDFIIQPEVTDAKLELLDFKLNRISKADGPVVRELSHSVENIMQEKLAEKNQKLVSKINRQIEKHRDQLRLSLSDLVKKKLMMVADEEGGGAGSTVQGSVDE